MLLVYWLEGLEGSMPHTWTLVRSEASPLPGSQRWERYSPKKAGSSDNHRQVAIRAAHGRSVLNLQAFSFGSRWHCLWPAGTRRLICIPSPRPPWGLGPRLLDFPGPTACFLEGYPSPILCSPCTTPFSRALMCPQGPTRDGTDRQGRIGMEPRCSGGRRGSQEWERGRCWNSGCSGMSWAHERPGQARAVDPAFSTADKGPLHYCA